MAATNTSPVPPLATLITGAKGVSPISVPAGDHALCTPGGGTVSAWAFSVQSSPHVVRVVGRATYPTATNHLQSFACAAESCLEWATSSYGRDPTSEDP
jgi:hypothetical protein